ncbi:MerR family transcriptional regulator [Microbispora sp. ZYX-F-249]|uniref:MerR family transcriptional regulator n=1 Tax=Microbispora maris TaxID=3144104 RepID=A0ABV0AJS1_9ACTN
MRIGELAALVGVSTRTVRHYHHQGVLPEPSRRRGGYREYGLRDALLLARARRLTELGLSLSEVRDVLTGDSARELREILLELDADLARQEAAIRARRGRLAALLSEEAPSPDDAVSPAMAEFLRCLEPVRDSPFAAAEAELLALLDAAAEPEDRDRLLELMRPMTTPEAVARAEVLHRRLAELDGADPADPRVAALAADLAAHLPRELAASLASAMPGADDPFAQAFLADLSPAQAEVARQAMALLAHGAAS